MAETYHLGLGANLGDPEETFGRVLDGLAERGTLCQVSSLYHSKPFGFAHQPDFRNAALIFSCELDPFACLELCQEIERTLGKQVLRDNGPRLIDIDLLFCGDCQLADPRLILPHPSAHQRDFVLRPLLEMQPDFVHPVLGLPARELLEAVKEPFVISGPHAWACGTC